MLRWGDLAILALCAACAPLPMPKSQLLATIPFEVRHGLPTVDVHIGDTTLRLFLDLGGHQAIALTAAELDRVNVRYLLSSSEYRNSKGQVFRARHFVAEDVHLGPFALGNVQGGEFMHGDSVPPDRNGYIGMPALSRYLLVFDYPKSQLRLYPSGDTTALHLECGSNTFNVRLVNGIAVSEGLTEFGQRLFIWDTGSTVNVIRPTALPAEKSRGVRSDEGPPIVRLQRLALNGVEIGPQDFRIVPFGAPAVDAYLGGGVFASRRVCLDIIVGRGAVHEAS